MNRFSLSSRVPASLAVAALALVACGSPPTSPADGAVDEDTVTRSDLVDTEWTIESIDLGDGVIRLAPGIDGAERTVNFSVDVLGGHDGCNAFGQTLDPDAAPEDRWDVVDGRLVVGNLISTLVACDDVPHQDEIRGIVGGEPAVVLSEGAPTLTPRDGLDGGPDDAVLVLRAADDA